MHRTENVKILTNILQYWILRRTCAFWVTETNSFGGEEQVRKRDSAPEGRALMHAT